jgi:hypothetical protein
MRARDYNVYLAACLEMNGDNCELRVVKPCFPGAAACSPSRCIRLCFAAPLELIFDRISLYRIRTQVQQYHHACARQSLSVYCGAVTLSFFARMHDSISSTDPRLMHQRNTQRNSNYDTTQLWLHRVKFTSDRSKCSRETKPADRRDEALGMLCGSSTTREVAGAFDHSHQPAGQKYNTTSTVHDRPHNGRPPILNDRQKKLIYVEARAAPEIEYKDLVGIGVTGCPSMGPFRSYTAALHYTGYSESSISPIAVVRSGQTLAPGHNQRR